MGTRGNGTDSPANPVTLGRPAGPPGKWATAGGANGTSPLGSWGKKGRGNKRRNLLASKYPRAFWQNASGKLPPKCFRAAAKGYPPLKCLWPKWLRSVWLAWQRIGRWPRLSIGRGHFLLFFFAFASLGKGERSVGMRKKGQSQMTGQKAIWSAVNDQPHSGPARPMIGVAVW